MSTEFLTQLVLRRVGTTVKNSAVDEAKIVCKVIHMRITLKNLEKYNFACQRFVCCYNRSTNINKYILLFHIR